MWFWADWRADVGLQACCLAAQGLWINMLSMMASSSKRGYLLDGVKQMDSKTLAKLVGETDAYVDQLLNELRKHEVFSEDADCIIYNRRMVRDSEKSRIRSECGRLGGLARSKGVANLKQSDSKGGSKVLAPFGYGYGNGISNSINNNLKTKKEATIIVGLEEGTIEQVIDYLNLKSGKKFSPKIKATRSHISARIAEGRTVQDFKKVIDIKVSAWENDPKMCAFIRPETLFGNKFEGYLNEQKKGDEGRSWLEQAMNNPDLPVDPREKKKPWEAGEADDKDRV
jgi:uncharacterized phage protein (TIGR02220 family)